MIREGQYKFVFNNNQIIPYKGKYPVKNESFFSDIGTDINKYYHPLRIEIEITNQCNDTCFHCGMKSRGKKDVLKLEQIDHIIQQMSDNKIPAIAITGGEPFLAMEEMSYIVSKARKNSIDTSKITSNAFWGKLDCSPQITPLIEAGILHNEFFVPTFMFSIGEQSTPLESSAL